MEDSGNTGRYTFKKLSRYYISQISSGKIKTASLQPLDILVSFDVVALFTMVPFKEKLK